MSRDVFACAERQHILNKNDWKGRWTVLLVGILGLWLTRKRFEIDYFVTQLLCGHGDFSLTCKKLATYALLTLFSVMKRWTTQVTTFFLWKVGWDSSVNLWRYTGVLFGQRCQRAPEECWQKKLCGALRLGSPSREEDLFRPEEGLIVPVFLPPRPSHLWMELPDLKAPKFWERQGLYIKRIYICVWRRLANVKNAQIDYWRTSSRTFWRRSSYTDNINALRVTMESCISFTLYLLSQIQIGCQEGYTL